MDTLKACTTNVQSIQGIDTTRVLLYRCHEPAVSSVDDVRGIAAELRQYGCVCTAIGRCLWVFEQGEEEIAAKFNAQIGLESQSTIAEQGQVEGSHTRPVYGIFLDALEESFSHSLLNSYRAVKISTFTWLLRENGSHDFGMLVRLQHQLSGDKKKLIIATSVLSSSGFRSAEGEPLRNQRLVLAPSGTAATLAVLGETGTRTGTEREDTQSAYLTEQWKTLVRNELLKEGIQLEYEASWLDVILSGSQLRISWPRLLCFTPIDTQNSGLGSGKEFNDWHHWFHCADLEDPFSFAENWSANFAERERLVNKDFDDEEHDSTAGGRADVSGIADTSGSAFDVNSPPLTNRPDLQALHGIYPTPPDGLANHAATQPQSDNVATANSDHANHAVSVPSDPPQESSTSLLDSAVQNVEGDNTQRNHSIASSVGLQAQSWNHGSSDDLFGDMDGLEYGREEVGDADFSFFDEPDGVPTKPDAELQHGTDPAALPEEQPLLAQSLESNFEEAQSDLQTLASHRQQNSHQFASAGPSAGSVVPSEGVDVLHAEDPIDLLEDTHRSPRMSAAHIEDSTNAKPLSPFGVREALLPPPVPASASQPHMAGGTERSSRRSSFGPLAFNSNGPAFLYPLAQGYSEFDPEGPLPSYYLAPTRIPQSASGLSPKTNVSLADSLADSEDSGSAESDSSFETSDIPIDEEPKTEKTIATATKKRKRTLDTSAYCGPQAGHGQRSNWIEKVDEKKMPDTVSEGELQDILFQILRKIPAQSTGHEHDEVGKSHRTSASDVQADPEVKTVTSTSSILEVSPRIESASPVKHELLNVLLTYPGLKLADLVVLSQVISEQAVSVTRSIAREVDVPGYQEIDPSNRARSLLSQLVETLKLIIPATVTCDVPSIALFREPFALQKVQPNLPNTSTTTQARHPPRPPPRLDPTTLGPDILPLGASFIRAQRGDGTWEMAPTALHFWEALGLAPVNGMKNIRHFCLAPDTELLGFPLTSFLHSLRATYEGCKFGSMAIGTETVDKTPSRTSGLAAITPITLDNSGEATIVSMLQAYWHACALLGAELAALAFDEPSRTLVVSILDPFSTTHQDDWPSINQHLGACFLNMSRAYTNSVTQSLKQNGKTSSPPAFSDIDFKILPVSLVSSATGLVVPTAQHMILLAREYYDRCPPPSEAIHDSSAMLNAAAPSVELVAPLPKRINFQLASDPPTDLLHEASVLHIAYAISKDKKWLTVAWHDVTGKYTSSSVFCMQGRSFADITLELWQRTLELIQAREVIWRIFIVTSGSEGIGPSHVLCWKDIIRKATDRKHYLSVTLLHFQSKVVLNVLPPSDAVTQLGQGTLSSGPTPVSTPQPGSGQGGPITSPDAISTGQAAPTAPPTPAPSETASNILEADPDAHLVDFEDETWGMLIDPDIAATLRPHPIWSDQTANNQSPAEAQAHAILIKRGKFDSTDCHPDDPGPYPCAGVSLIWTLRVRPRSARQAGAEKDVVDEGSVRHAEVMLREVLGMFRNLGILSRVRGLDSTGLTPVHIITAARGAEGLEGLLPASMEP